jgi:Sec7-like guanine-nucleotide exchange factor
MEFTNMAFDDALRVFLSKFTLPREAQMIDRVMERFAQRYCQCEPKLFTNSDVGYILAFSLIMLNTDAHNDNIKPDRKMTKLQFVANNRGIDNGKDLPRDYLEELYDRIVSNAFQMEHERDDFAQWDKQGFIYVKETKFKDSTSTLSLSKKRKVGKKLWCIISSFCLFIFASPQVCFFIGFFFNFFF